MEFGVGKYTEAIAAPSVVAAALLITLPIVSIIIYHLAARRRGEPDYLFPPGPVPLPVLGNLLHLTGSELPHRALAKLAQKYGPVFHLRLGSRHAVVVSSAALARQFLQGDADRCFASRPRTEVAVRVGWGQEKSIALGPYGPQWRALRRMCTVKLLTTRRVQSFEPIRREEVRLCVRQIAQQCGAPDSSRVVDLTAAIAGLMESIICRVLTSKRMPDVVGPHGSSTLRELVRRLTTLSQAPVVGDFIPWLGVLDKKLKCSMDELHHHFDMLLDNLLQERALNHIADVDDDLPGDFLDVLLSNSMGKDDIKAILVEMMAGGIDTTTVTIDWALAETLSNPKVLEKIQNELDNVVGRQRMVEESDLPGLVYIKAMIKEIFRLHAPLPLLVPHMSMEASEIDGYTLPKDTILFVNMWAIGRDSKVWDDPHEFKPERFLGNQNLIDIRGKHFELLPFGTGRRSCPGMPLAMPTLEIALSNLLHCFHWRLSEESSSIDLSEKFGIVTSRASPLLVIPSPRLDLALFSIV